MSGLRQSLGQRLRRVRLERYGQHGGPLLAQALGLSFRRWCGYEDGRTLPAPVLLRFIELTGVNPH